MVTFKQQEKIRDIKMQLKDYLELKNYSIRQFAKMLNVSHPSVIKWIEKKGMPRPALILQIEALTKGRVKLKDLLEKKNDKGNKAKNRNKNKNKKRP